MNADELRETLVKALREQKMFTLSVPLGHACDRLADALSKPPEEPKENTCADNPGLAVPAPPAHGFKVGDWVRCTLPVLDDYGPAQVVSEAEWLASATFRMRIRGVVYVRYEYRGEYRYGTPDCYALIPPKPDEAAMPKGEKLTGKCVLAKEGEWYVSSGGLVLCALEDHHGGSDDIYGGYRWTVDRIEEPEEADRIAARSVMSICSRCEQCKLDSTKNRCSIMDALEGVVCSTFGLTVAVRTCPEFATMD